MTDLLERAFAEAAKLPPDEQNLIASRLLAELAAEDEFDRAIQSTAGRLAGLAGQAIEEHRAGLTRPLDAED